MEKVYRESKLGLWHHFWYKCGSVVLKAGVAVVFKVGHLF